MVGIEAHLGRKIESHRKPGGSLAEQITVTAVTFLGGAKSGILPHGPKAAAIHVAVDAASVRKLAGRLGSLHEIRSVKCAEL